MNAPSINTLLTVIICTYNRAFILGECLESLTRQTAPAETFTVLVIDNSSKDDTQAVAASYSGGLPGLRIVFESRQGLSHARNRGVAEAQTEWVAFLDDDAKASPNWGQTILNTIGTGDFDCFGGPYYAWHKFGPPPAWIEEDFGTYPGPGQYDLLENLYHIPGGNCAFKKNLAEAVGGFPVDIGMKGKKCAYGEETLLFEKLRRSGARLGFVPSMRIDHCVLPYKYSLWWRLKSEYAYGLAGPGSFLMTPGVRDIYGAWVDLLKAGICFAPGRFWNALKKNLPWKRGIHDAFGPVFNSFGYVVSLSSLWMTSVLRKNIP